MIFIHVTHFLNADCLEYFPRWFVSLQPLIEAQDGFLNIGYKINLDQTAAEIILTFASEPQLNAWAKSEKHRKIIGQINNYRTKPYSVTREEFVPKNSSKSLGSVG
jgi:antibiotic biosynthesis monooxygenase (ABM) superfamily enzyme